MKIIDSLPTENAAMKIVYLRVAELNERWSHMTTKGYYKCKDRNHRHVQGEVSLGLHIIIDTAFNYSRIVLKIHFIFIYI